MSWEANRWTAKTPAELFHTFGPHGVDELVRKSMNACWRQLPDEGRSVALARKAAREVYDRNIAAWAKIKEPSPEAFFADLPPHEADHLMRQAMVTCWMMMPRTGGREVADVRRIVGGIFDRNMEAWEQDEATFTGKTKRKASTKAPAPKIAKKANEPSRAKQAKRSKR